MQCEREVRSDAEGMFTEYWMSRSEKGSAHKRWVRVRLLHNIIQDQARGQLCSSCAHSPATETHVNRHTTHSHIHSNTCSLCDLNTSLRACVCLYSARFILNSWTQINMRPKVPGGSARPNDMGTTAHAGCKHGRRVCRRAVFKARSDMCVWGEETAGVCIFCCT